MHFLHQCSETEGGLEMEKNGHNPCAGIIRIRFGGYNLSHCSAPLCFNVANIVKGESSDKRKRSFLIGQCRAASYIVQIYKKLFVILHGFTKICILRNILFNLLSMRMKHSWLKLWLLLLLALVFFVFVAAFDDIRIFGRPLAKLDLSAFETVDTEKTEQIVQKEGNVPVVTKPVEADTLPKVILFIGDSMLEGLSPRFAAYAEKNGHTLYSVIWYGSTTEKWAKSHRLSDYIAKCKPDYVVVCLGGNELFIRDIERQRAPYVETILKEIGVLPYVWIGPPNWKPDTGINRLIESKVKDGCFFESQHLTLDRASDGAHPTREAAAQWMDSVANWIFKRSAVPVRLDKPAKMSGKAKRVFVHTPEE